MYKGMQVAVGVCLYIVVAVSVMGYGVYALCSIM